LNCTSNQPRPIFYSGDDLVDLSVIHFVNFTWTHSNRILASFIPDECSADVEEELIRKRKFLGAAWEPGKSMPHVVSDPTVRSDKNSTNPDSAASDDSQNLSVSPNEAPRL